MKTTVKKAMKVYTVLEGKKNKSRFKQIGLAFVNKDESLNVFIHTPPINGRLCISNFTK
ncbi:MAG: hypothetical protein HQM16_10705 [Deltaproteobacteria bacterium]|nr:hypothetical protein [Deltaproteobacteria bacterium]